MCLILLGWRVHPEFDLVVGANRDEFHARPSQSVHWWKEPDDLLAGRDLRAGGTWLGVRRGGRFAAVTNVRDPGNQRPDARSRGELPVHFLGGSDGAGSYARQVHAARAAWNGFNLVVGDGETLWFAGARAEAPRELGPGIYGISNASLDTPWPKVEQGKAAFTDALGQLDPEGPVLELLADRHHAPDEDLPDTGVGLAWERALSSRFIVGAEYGTRSTTYVAQRGSRLRLVEREYGPSGAPLGERRFET
jgi:uncharacterized protein with NRDE domain